MIPRLKNISYEKDELNLYSLSKGRMRRDLINVFRIFKGCDIALIQKIIFTDDQ